MSLLLTLTDFTDCSDVSTVDFEQVNAGWSIFIFDLILVFSCVNPLQPGVAFLYPLKTSENF